jgi:beta-hydroxylase
MIFDDTHLHHVNNNTNEQRVVLFLDIQKKYNIFLDIFNDLFFLLFKHNSTIIEIYNKVNNCNITKLN